MPKRILIADDSAPIRHLIRAYLESQSDFEVCGEAADGAEAIEKARKLRPHVIVLDLSMPRMSGLEAAVILRSVSPNVPIILFTLHKEALPDEEARAAGFRAVVSKSEGLKALFEEVQRLTSLAKPALARM